MKIKPFKWIKEHDGLYDCSKERFFCWVMRNEKGNCWESELHINVFN